jgi:hypothetical protein
MLAFAIVAIAANAQVPYYTPAASEADSSKGAETDYLVIPHSFSAVNDLVIQVLCTQLGGTSDGKITLQKSVDGTSWLSMNTTTDDHLKCANDTFTIVNAGVANFRLKTYDYKYRLKFEGTTGDTTLLTTKYLFK